MIYFNEEKVVLCGIGCYYEVKATSKINLADPFLLKDEGSSECFAPSDTHCSWKDHSIWSHSIHWNEWTS